MIVIVPYSNSSLEHRRSVLILTEKKAAVKEQLRPLAHYDVSFVIALEIATSLGTLTLADSAFVGICFPKISKHLSRVRFVIAIGPLGDGKKDLIS